MMLSVYIHFRCVDCHLWKLCIDLWRAITTWFKILCNIYQDYTVKHTDCHWSLTSRIFTLFLIKGSLLYPCDALDITCTCKLKQLVIDSVDLFEWNFRHSCRIKEVVIKNVSIDMNRWKFLLDTSSFCKRVVDIFPITWQFVRAMHHSHMLRLNHKLDDIEGYKKNGKGI